MTLHCNNHDPYSALIGSNTTPIDYDGSNDATDPANPAYNAWAPWEDTARIEAERREWVW
jgi:hypothetical protein